MIIDKGLMTFIFCCGEMEFAGDSANLAGGGGMATETGSAPRGYPSASGSTVLPGAIIGVSGGLVLRHARDADAAAIIALISAVWSEYPGKTLVAANDMPELLRPASAYARCDGRFWLVENR